MKQTLSNLGLTHVWKNQGTLNIQRLKHTVISILQQNYEKYWNLKKTITSRLTFYNFITTEYRLEPYLLVIKNINHRKALSRLRTSTHNLEIERGRYINLPRNERKCTTCDKVEDELHFLNDCKKLESLRNQFLIKIKNKDNVSDNKSTKIGDYFVRDDMATLVARFVYESVNLMEKT